MLLPHKDSFKLRSSSKARKSAALAAVEAVPIESAEIDSSKRTFLRLAGLVGLGVVASQAFPDKAKAYVLGGAPTSPVVGIKNAANTRVNPATDETLSSLISGQSVNKLTMNIISAGPSSTALYSPSGKMRVYASRFSLNADATSVSFRFTSLGDDHEKYMSPKAGGLYGANNHPNYFEGGTGQALYCVIAAAGTTTVQINIDYLEV